MSDKYGVGQDPYCYPGTRVLKNRLGLKDDATLQRAESEITTKALHDIQFNASPYDFNYLKTIHRQLFGHLYDWAGAARLSTNGLMPIFAVFIVIFRHFRRFSCMHCG